MWSEGLVGVSICGMIIISIVTIIVQTVKRRRASEKFPPGPLAWPVLGHLHLFRNLPHQALALLSRKHGDVLGLRLGQRRAVVVSSPHSARQVLLTHDKLFADRPLLDFMSSVLFGSRTGVIFNSHGPQWRKNRKTCMLRLFTAKRLRELQYVRHQELRAFLLSIHRHSCAGTTPVDLGSCVGQMSSRLILRLLHSRASLGDENLPKLMKEVEQVGFMTFGDVVPCLSWLDFFRKQRMHHIHARLDRLYNIMLTERKESAVIHDDLLHTLLSDEEGLSVIDIKSILHDMLGAGIHTTALALEWTMAELLRNPRCLHRLKREINTKVGEEKEVTEADLPNLSYLKCIIKEASRLHPAAPLLLPHLSMKECNLQGYTIPAETLVFVNVWAIGRDERVWPNANEFMPERFEGKDIDLKGQHFELLPFGSGRRMCLGLPLALSVIEVTLANLVHCFDWELPLGETCTSINMDERKGFTANKATPVLAIPKPRPSFSALANVEACLSKE